MTGRPAVFLDRDGVLIDDVDLLVRRDQVRLPDDVPVALRRLADAGFALVVVTNQTVIARGLATPAEVDAINAQIAHLIAEQGGPRLTEFRVCPHHPQATLPAYRRVCGCRKPRPGMLLEAASVLALDLRRSFMVGDRISDVAAGRAAGCRTVLVQTGAHTSAPIVSDVSMDGVRPDHTCARLADAGAWILSSAERSA
jgi:D-glycero-D-manno-heptose 1,7-bisphosphate phosphatase